MKDFHILNSDFFTSSLKSRFGDDLRWYVPSALKQWMNNQGCQNVVELTWWEEDKFTGSEGDFKFVCTPCQHWTKRTVADDNKVEKLIVFK